KMSTWLRFLRHYGPIPRNDNMYDETIQRSARRQKITPIEFEHPMQDLVLRCFDKRSVDPVSVILTGTAGACKTAPCPPGVESAQRGREGLGLRRSLAQLAVFSSEGSERMDGVERDRSFPDGNSAFPSRPQRLGAAKRCCLGAGEGSTLAPPVPLYRLRGR